MKVDCIACYDEMKHFGKMSRQKNCYSFLILLQKVCACCCKGEEACIFSSRERVCG